MDILLLTKKVCFYFGELFRIRSGFRSYSMFGEDVMLRGFMQRRRWSYRGFYVDIGAYHPTDGSNTKMYSLVGWQGINVDPSVNTIELFNRHRKRDINVNVGIGKAPGTLDYYRMSSPSMNTFSKEFAEKAQDLGVKLLETVKVPVITMKTLLDKYLPQGQAIDFMSIDCEGLDVEILESNDWTRYRPEYILIEIHTGGGGGYPKSSRPRRRSTWRGRGMNSLANVFVRHCLGESVR